MPFFNVFIVVICLLTQKILLLQPKYDCMNNDNGKEI